MGRDKHYTIRYGELADGLQTLSFEIDSDFFASIEGSEIVGGKCVANIDVVKALSTLQMDISIEGEVTVSCDRCLEEVKIPINYGGRLMVKFSTEVEDVEYILDTKEEDTVIANPLVGELDIREYLYDSIILSLPIQRVHADDAPEGEGCNPDMLARFGVLDNTPIDTIEWDSDLYDDDDNEEEDN